jgi:maleylacetate reductase
VNESAIHSMPLNVGRDCGWSLPPLQQTVAFGVPLEDALPQAALRLSARRLAVVTTNSLTGPGGLAEALRNILGSKLHSFVAGIHSHTPRADVVRVIKALEGADGVVTLGGGSVCDSAKAARLCLANGITDAAGMDRLRSYDKAKGSEPDSTISPSLPFIAVATTLSAAEFTSGAGVTDERGPRKQVFVYPGLAPDIVILDPHVTRQTPPRLWFSTGMRALDHALETWCSTNPTPLSDAYSSYAARLLITSLQKVFDSPNDLQARLDCMKGAWLSILGPAAGVVKAGASHGMGHALGGTAGMPHGETSCVMLPHVLRYNASVNGDRQAVIAASVGNPTTPLADIVAGLILHLGLPTRIRDTGVSETVMAAVAEAALHDPLLASNPRPIKSLTEVRLLLEQAW